MLRKTLSLLMLSALFSLFAKADPIKVGDTAPEVVGTTHTGDTLNLRDLYHTHEYTLVYFYPKADTPGCTKQGCSLRDAYAELTKLGVAVVGVSTDSVEAQKAFREKYKLPFTLIADREHKVIDAFGVPLMPAVGFAKRQAFLIKRGKVIWADLSASTEKQAEDVIKVLKAQS